MKEYCYVFQAETAAIKHAVEELITFNNQQITFWSDSLSALQALSTNNCHKALTKLADENTVHLKWIKAHTGHWGNEKADEFAKAGMVCSNLYAATCMQQPVCSLVPLNHIKNMINDKVNSLTHKRWNSNRHAHTHLILGNHHTKTLKILRNNLNNRTRYCTGKCIITGHIGLNKHLHRINCSDTSNCTNTEETVAHYTRGINSLVTAKKNSPTVIIIKEQIPAKFHNFFPGELISAGARDPVGHWSEQSEDYLIMNLNQF